MISLRKVASTYWSNLSLFERFLYRSLWYSILMAIVALFIAVVVMYAGKYGFLFLLFLALSGLLSYFKYVDEKAEHEKMAKKLRDGY